MGTRSPSSRQARLNALSSIAFSGVPWPTNSAGILPPDAAALDVSFTRG
jgi:hypothetical protein